MNCELQIISKLQPDVLKLHLNGCNMWNTASHGFAFLNLITSVCSARSTSDSDAVCDAFMCCEMWNMIGQSHSCQFRMKGQLRRVSIGIGWVELILIRV